MTGARIDHLGVVVDDLDAAVAFFGAVGFERSGDWRAEGRWVDRVIGLDDVRSDVVGLRAPGGGTWLELSRFERPVDGEPADAAAANRLGLRHLAVQVDDLDATLDRLRALDVVPLGAVEQYEEMYRLCYVRGPAGVLVELAQEVTR